MMLVVKLLKQKGSCSDNNEIVACFNGIIGSQEQKPPIYSAIKVNGKNYMSIIVQESR